MLIVNCLTFHQNISPAESSSWWSVNTSFSPRFQPNADTFSRSGFDRGHLAAAGNHRSAGADLDPSRSTYSYVNCSPQIGVEFNRGYWERLERMVRNWVAAAGGSPSRGLAGSNTIVDLTPDLEFTEVYSGPVFYSSKKKSVYLP